VDADWLDGKAAGHDAAPAILLEGTALINGCSSSSPPGYSRTLATDKCAAFNTALLQQLPCDVAFDKAIRNTATLAAATQHQVYGPIYGLVSADHRGRAIHMALLDPSSGGRVGVPQSLVLGAGAPVDFAHIQSFTAGSRAALYTEIPRCAIPTVTADMEQALAKQLTASAPAGSPSAFRVDIHSQTYALNSSIIDAAMARVCLDAKCVLTSRQLVRLTETLAVEQFWLEAQ
jgi:hypothetical protein